MALRSCRVTITDPDGVEHSTEVTADSLFEAVGLALAAMHTDDWAPASGLRFRIAVRQPVVEHVVERRRFEAWLSAGARSPREMAVKERIRGMLQGGGATD